MITVAMILNQHSPEKLVEIAGRESYTFQEESTPH
jgi:hypothetical protein